MKGDDDRRLVDALDAALSELQHAGADNDPEAWFQRHGGGSPEMASLLLTLRRVEEVVRRWIDSGATLPEEGPATQSLDVSPTPARPDGPDAALSPGEFIGRYRIEGRAGGGGMGTVYRAHDPALGRTVAIKVPHFDPARLRPGTRERFLREARAAAAVRHPHVCPVYDAGEHNGVPYVVMAFVEGPSLAFRLAGGTHLENVREAAELARQVAEGLAAVHACGIVHRDLKPANVLLDPSGAALLADFGLAKPADAPNQLTGAWLRIGTPAYMAPEQARGDADRVGPATDVYGLGAVLYECLTGVAPHAARRQNDAGAIPPPSSLRPGLDPRLDALVLRALAARPEERYPSARSFADALRDWLGAAGAVAGVCDPGPASQRPATGSVGGTEPSTERGRGSRPEGRGRLRAGQGRRWAAAGVAACALIAVAWLLAGWGGPDPAPPDGQAIAPGPPAREPDLSGTLSVRVWNTAGIKRGLRVDEPGALPVVNGEGVRVEVKLNRPAYLYLVWVDAGGETQPIYPWDPVKGEDWNTPMPAQSPRAGVELPADGPDRGFIADGRAGLDTVILLARDTPLPPDQPLEQLLGRFPAASALHASEVAWLEFGPGLTRARHERPPLHRGLKLGESLQIDEPVLRLMERLRPHFTMMKAVRFARAER